MTLFLLFFLACTGSADAEPVAESAPETNCTGAKNTCTDYAPSWVDACPAGDRCITFRNSSSEKTVALAYQIGCNGDGTAGAPQCNCTDGPTLAPGAAVYWKIVDGAYDSCLPSWTPACLTAGLAVLVNEGNPSCTTGTRVEFTAGNIDNIYNKFDSYNIDIEKNWYSVPVTFKPNLTCAVDHENHDCRPLWCDSDVCPDAYHTATTGGCPDGRSPQGSCQDTFNRGLGYTVEYYPASGKSCQDAKACP